MKKLLPLIIAMVSVLALTSCGKTPQVATLALESNPTTGYTWSAEQSEALFEISSEYVQGEEAQNLVGAGGADIFTLVPLKAGKCDVTFTYARSWEDNEDNDTWTFQMEITKDKQIKVISSEGGVAGDADSIPTVPQFVIEAAK